MKKKPLINRGNIITIGKNPLRRCVYAGNRRTLLGICRFALMGGLSLVFIACSFDYGEGGGENRDIPDIIMKGVEYVRVRNGDPLVRFTAEYAERYEERQTMELKNFSFEQFGHQGEDINAVGRAGTASVELDSGNIRMREGVWIEVDSEDISIETLGLDWEDKEKRLSAGEYEQVNMRRSDGTNFSGQGFSANIRERTWGFSSGIEGTYVWEDDEEETGDGEEAETPGNEE
ncbi:MAG: LPS export ABC transporter periplasmic protein LptC [Treponema sp.]|jgi:LPS export ABC transporter protein LptC|nr:LPS export ABC transporter periplasmic protein LptC [Treponema sp.]